MQDQKGCARRKAHANHTRSSCNAATTTNANGDDTDNDTKAKAYRGAEWLDSLAQAVLADSLDDVGAVLLLCVHPSSPRNSRQRIRTRTRFSHV